MSFVWDDKQSDMENIRRVIQFIIQTIENTNPTNAQIIEQLRALADRIR